MLAKIPEKITLRFATAKYDKAAGHIIVAGNRLTIVESQMLNARDIGEPLLSSVQSIVTLLDFALVVTMYSNGRLIFRDELTLQPLAVLRQWRGFYSPSVVAVAANCSRLAVSYFVQSGDQWITAVTVHSISHPK